MFELQSLLNYSAHQTVSRWGTNLIDTPFSAQMNRCYALVVLPGSLFDLDDLWVCFIFCLFCCDGEARPWKKAYIGICPRSSSPSIQLHIIIKDHRVQEILLIIQSKLPFKKAYLNLHVHNKPIRTISPAFQNNKHQQSQPWSWMCFMFIEFNI